MTSSAKLNASAVALLHEFGERTPLRGGNPYPQGPIRVAAENLVALSELLEDLTVPLLIPRLR
jgi:hypothetical protein